MSRRMQCNEAVLADRDTVAFMNRQPVHRESPVLVGPRVLEEPSVTMRARNGSHARRMVGMSVCHQDIAKLCVMTFERGGQFLDVTALTDAGINQHGGPVLFNQQIGVVARTGHRARIVRVEPYGIEHVNRRWIAFCSNAPNTEDTAT